MRNLITRFGWPNVKNRLNFGHTITGTIGRGFYLQDIDDHIVIKNQSCPDEALAFWTHDTIMNPFVAKLQHEAVVLGERKGNFAKCNCTHFLQSLKFENLLMQLPVELFKLTLMPVRN